MPLRTTDRLVAFRFNGAVRRCVHVRTAFGIGPCVQSDAKGGGVEPTAERFFPVDAAGLFQQNEKGCLEGVVDVGGIGQDAVARGQERAFVPPHEQFKGGGVAGFGEAREESAVGIVADGGVKMRQDSREC